MRTRGWWLAWLGAGVLSACNVPIEDFHTFAQEAYVKASNAGASDFFGYSVALSADGSTLAVGAYAEDSAATGIDGNQNNSPSADAGAVYVFTRSGETWRQQAYVKASNTSGGDLFGYSLALSADGATLAVGAPHEGSGAIGIDGNQADDSVVNAGAVYVFARSGTAWNQQAYVKASNTDAGDFFGASVALSSSGATLAVGAFQEASAATGIGGNQADNAALNAGAVYVFTRNGKTWVQEAYLKASNTSAGDNFGTSVALSGDGLTLAASAIHEASAVKGVNGNQADDNAPDAGAVYVFTRSGPTWRQQAYVKASNTGAGDNFGTSVTLSGDGSTLAVSARNEDSAATGIDGNQVDNSVGSAGAVYVFTREDTTWSQEAYVKASNTAAEQSFGVSAALSSDGATLAVGAFEEGSPATGIGGDQADQSAGQAGAVYVFTRGETTWSQQVYVKASNTNPLDQFGWSLALSGDGLTLAVGAVREDSASTGVDNNQADNDAPDAGAVYVFH
jgi:FG-GAP repeat